MLSFILAGNIKINSIVTEKLQSTSLEGKHVNDLFTTSTDQKITNAITFPNINANNVQTNQVNSIDIELAVATSSSNALHEIRGPVSIKNMAVFGNMHFTDSLKAQFDDTPLNTLQIYDKVKIVGNLNLKNFKSFTNANITVNGKLFNKKIMKGYWLKKKQQVIPDPIEALAGISVPHLITKNLNNIPINEYMLNDNQDKIPSNFYFEDVHIRGNLNITKGQILHPDLEVLNQVAVRLNGR